MPRVQLTARMESVRFLHNVHGRFTTSDGNMAHHTIPLRDFHHHLSHPGSAGHASPPEDLHNQTSVQWQTVSETNQLMAALMPGKNTQYKCIL